MNNSSALLRALAEVEESLHKISGRLSEMAQEEERLRGRLAKLEAALAQRREEHRQLRLSAQERAAEADATDAKIREYQRKLEHDIVPYREMEFLREQVQLLRAKLDQVSEEALKLMEAVEEDARKLAQDEASYRERQSQLMAEIQRMAQRREEIRREGEVLETRRQELVEKLPAQLRQHYERLRSRLPNPVVYVNGQTCGGCHLRLAEATLLKLHEGREVVICEHCSRFLVGSRL
ncbi:MAG: zinc ribbon domain-containing protein [Candidatus Bipolaricaulaceae bacterium]